MARESAGRSEAAFALNTMAIIAGEQCNFSAARAFLEESLGIRRELGDQALTAKCAEQPRYSVDPTGGV